jgi:hypothetical protein
MPVGVRHSHVLRAMAIFNYFGTFVSNCCKLFNQNCNQNDLKIVTQLGVSTKVQAYSEDSSIIT